MDAALFWGLHALADHEALAAVARFFSSAWVPVGVSVPLGLYLLYRRRFAAMLSVALAAGCGDALTARIIKPVVGRERPCRALQDVLPVAKCGSGKSFPSGHATVAFSYATAASGVVPYGVWFFVPLAVLVALSRVVLGVHYPSDITAGAFVGLAVGLLFVWARRRFEPSEADAEPEA